MATSEEWQGDGHGVPISSPDSPKSLPASGRTVGPVTMATGGAAAMTGIACWILSLNGITVPPLEQGSITVLLIMLAGWAVKPSGQHSA